MTPKGADLEATDLIEVSTLESGSYVTRSITGQELIDAIPLPPSGLTVGTTPIASGTAGRVLFEGTGNVLQESANLFWDNTNARLGIGTSTPSASVHSAGSVNGSFSSLFQNTSTGIQGSTGINVANNSATIGGVSTYSSANNTAYLRSNVVLASYPTASNVLLATNFDVATGGTGSIQLLTGGYAGNPTKMIVFGTTGNVLIQNGGTHTDAGFRLDVNGTARVQDNFTIAKTTASALTVNLTSLVAQNNFLNILNGTDGLLFTSRGNATTGSMGLPANSAEITSFQKAALGIILHNTAYLAIGTNTTERMRLVGSTGNVLIGTTTDAGYKLDVNGTARISGAVTTTTTITAGGNIQGTNLISTANMWCQNILYGTNFFVSLNGSAIFGGTSSNASAILQADSTTKGFLPPRMTTTQRNAIASPAAGLVVYDNTDNKHYGYNGTTWNAFY
jgi:hypothetical protein